MKPFQPVVPPRVQPAEPEEVEVLEEVAGDGSDGSDGSGKTAAPDSSGDVRPEASLPSLPSPAPRFDEVLARNAETAPPVVDEDVECGDLVFVRVGGVGGRIRPAIVTEVLPGRVLNVTSFTPMGKFGVDPLRHVQPCSLRESVPGANLWAFRRSSLT